MHRVVRWAAAGCLLAGLAVAVQTAQAAGPRPALFRVGAAVESIAPPVPIYAGGFGVSPPITNVLSSDPLQVRAIYISNGKTAVAFATVDSQAEFAAYQEGPHYGITAARDDAAALIDAHRFGPRITAADIIVQGTHSHSAATLEGIWGPVPTRYLRLVHDQTVRARPTCSGPACGRHGWTTSTPASTTATPAGRRTVRCPCSAQSTGTAVPRSRATTRCPRTRTSSTAPG